MLLSVFTVGILNNINLVCLKCRASCFVCGRSRTSLTKLQNITFHKFSADPKIREKWFDFLKENGLDVGITKHSLILCSSHFDPSLFQPMKKTTQKKTSGKKRHGKKLKTDTGKNVNNVFLSKNYNHGF